MTLIVEKVYREDELESIDPSFGKLINLHLELLENKKKLKAGLPPLIIPKLNLPPVEEQIKEKEKDEKRGNDKRDDKRGDDKRDEKRKDKSRNRDKDDADSDRDTGRRRSRDEKMSKKTAEKDDIANELGDYEDEVEPPKEKSSSSSSDKKAKDEKRGDKRENDKRESDKRDDDKYDDKHDEKSARGDKKEKREKKEEAGEEEQSEEQKQEDSETANMSPEEKEKYEKEEMTWRFRILKKQYKDANIPDFNEHSDLTRMKRAYTRILKELHLDDSVETFRNWLIGGFIVTEWVCTKFVGIDLTGFTKRQICMMKKYDRMLIELGERSYASFGSSLPVEVRLVGFIVIQAGIFYLGKIIADHAGSTVAELFNGLTGQPPVTSHVTSSEGGGDAPVKKKMKGPSLKASDIKRLKEEVLRNDEKNSSPREPSRDSREPPREPPREQRREQPKEASKEDRDRQRASSESSVKKRHEESDDDHHDHDD